MKITCAKLVGGPGDQNRDIHLPFPGPRLQHGYQIPPCDVTTGRYIMITKPRCTRQLSRVHHTPPLFSCSKLVCCDRAVSLSLILSLGPCALFSFFLQHYPALCTPCMLLRIQSISTLWHVSNTDLPAIHGDSRLSR